MGRFVLAAAACLALAPAFAADPLKSAACGDALGALQAARTAGQADAAEFARRRDAASRACLGGAATSGRPAPVAQAPLVVPPPAIEVPQPPRPPVQMPPIPPLAVEQPPVITSCDTAGCWDSHGTRLNSAGPLLLGPGGACTVAGSVVRCP